MHELQYKQMNFLRKPSLYIPTLYFAEGLPNAVVTLISSIYYKDIGFDNSFIGAATTFAALPWMLKFLWAPFVDLYGDKRKWVLVLQMVLAAALMVLAAFTLMLPSPTFTLGAFLLIALASATFDISLDGYYLEILKPDQQAFYVGWRSAAFRLAWLFGQGGLVFLAGYLNKEQHYTFDQAFACVFALCSLIFVALTILHFYAIPHSVNLTRSVDRINIKEFFQISLSYFKQEKIAICVVFILLFRIGEALMLKMATLFLLDTPMKGGLSISTENVGIIYGTVGVMTLVAGGIVGSWYVSKVGLKKCLLPCAIAQLLAMLGYCWLSWTLPSDNKFACTVAVNCLEQFFYGIGMSAFLVFILSTVKSQFKAAHYAMATAIMALGLYLPQAVSGFLCDYLGYKLFFIVSFCAAIPGIIIIPFLPLQEEGKNAIS
ncbi:MFS transporter [bacterium]|nr:MFS transporter [bacterium]QQR58523.1 MAG: MFS transporter [Candidatus Melainabacteria bacterium]